MRAAHLAAFVLASGLVLQAADHTIVFLGGEDTSAWYGAQQGLFEANLQGQFLDTTFVLGHDPKAAGPLAIIATGGNLSSALDAADAGMAVINISDRGDALRTACRPNLLHTIPSEAMLADAAAQWRKTHPADTAVEALAWHASAYKFAARDLNKRFAERQGRPMDDEAWAAWAAVRLVAEAYFRTQSGDPAEILRYLREDAEFDGNKGPVTSFRATGQLRQLLMLSKAGELVGEAPVRGAADPEDLDSLGMQACQEH